MNLLGTLFHISSAGDFCKKWRPHFFCVSVYLCVCVDGWVGGVGEVGGEGAGSRKATDFVFGVKHGLRQIH